MTEHPLADDLTQLSLDDLEKRLAMLTQRYYAARRMNMNQGIIYQLDLLLQGLEYEKIRRAQPPLDTNPIVVDTDENYKKP